MTSKSERAKAVLLANMNVRFGIFGAVASSNYFPPHKFLNEFLLGGSDSCDQDGRMAPWQPFALTAKEFAVVEAWWRESHPGAVTDALDAESWREWAVGMLESRDD